MGREYEGLYEFESVALWKGLAKLKETCRNSSCTIGQISEGENDLISILILVIEFSILTKKSSL